MLILLIITAVALILSLIFDRKKTWQGIRKGLKMFLHIIPPFLTILIIVSILLYFTPKEFLIKWLGKDSGAVGMIVAAVIGSISLIPAFIAYPLGAILIKNGVTYSVIAVFITTLTMVGIITMPLESKFFGWKAAITRNFLSFIGAIIIGLLIGLLWGLI